jgi:hypothetical protein
MNSLIFLQYFIINNVNNVKVYIMFKNSVKKIRINQLFIVLLYGIFGYDG